MDTEGDRHTGTSGGGGQAGQVDKDVDNTRGKAAVDAEVQAALADNDIRVGIHLIKRIRKQTRLGHLSLVSFSLQDYATQMAA